MKWEDFFEVQLRPFVFWTEDSKRPYRLVTRGQPFGVWPTYTTEGRAIAAAKKRFATIQKQIEKDLLGEE